MKSTIISLIRFYQRVISPDQGFINEAGLTRIPRCSFYPTCSEYAVEAVSKYGVLRGTRLFLIRITKCHPWQKNHVDPLL